MSYEDSYEREENIKKKALEIQERQLSLAEQALSQNNPSMRLNPNQASRLSEAVEQMNALRDERRMCADIAASLMIEKEGLDVGKAVDIAEQILVATSNRYAPHIQKAKDRIGSILSEVKQNGDPVGNP